MTLELTRPSTEPAPTKTASRPDQIRWWWFLTTTPGRILVSGVVLMALVILSAVATATTIDSRQRALTTVLNHTEPLAYAAGQLYTTLSVADAAATTAFIAGTESRNIRQRYDQAITNAAVALTRASSGLTDPAMLELLGRINARLAVYTGLIETARTNNRVGYPVGSSYLFEASALMQEHILPDAQRLYEQTAARVDLETTASTRIPALFIVAVALTLLFGAYSNRWLARRTKRRINIGFVAGGLAGLILVLWTGTVLTISTTESRTAKDTAAESLKSITNMAITAQQARADEILALIRRGDEGVRKEAFYGRIGTLDEQLHDYLERSNSIDKEDLKDAGELLARWRQADERINAYTDVGNYRAATQVALGSNENDSTPAFDKLHQALDKAMAQSRSRLRTDIFEAGDVLAGATVGAVLLSIFAGVAVALALWPRLSEYR